MNKSKFLKKSLAMLLALMLVVAMIPLSASAAGALPNLDRLYIDDYPVTAEDGVFAFDIGENDEKDPDVKIKIDTHSLGTTEGTASAYIVKGDTVHNVNLAEGSDETIDLSEWGTEADGVVTLTLRVWSNDKSDSKDYTIELTRTTDSRVAKVESVSAGDGTYKASFVDNAGTNNIYMDVARNAMAADKGAYVKVTPAEKGNVTGTGVTNNQDGTYTVKVTGDKQTITVNSQSGSVHSEYTIYVTVYDALRTLDINEVVGEFSDSNNDTVADTVTVTLPESMARDELGYALPNVKLPMNFTVYGDSVSLEVNDASTGTDYATFKSGEKIDLGNLVEENYRAKLTLDAAGYDDLQEYALEVKLESSTNTAIERVQMNEQLLTEVEGTDISVSVPYDTDLTKVDVVLFTKPDVKSISGFEPAHKAGTNPYQYYGQIYNDEMLTYNGYIVWVPINYNGDTNVTGAYSFNEATGLIDNLKAKDACDLTKGLIVTVTSEADTTQQYTLRAKPEENRTVAQLKGLILQDPETGKNYEGNIVDHKVVFDDIPYMTVNVAGWKVFAKTNDAATAKYNKVDNKYENTIINGTTTAGNIGFDDALFTQKETAADVNKKNATTIQVQNMNDPTQVTEYHVEIVLPDPKTGKTLNNIDFHALVTDEVGGFTGKNNDQVYALTNTDNLVKTEVESKSLPTNNTGTITLNPAYSLSSKNNELTEQGKTIYNIVNSFATVENGVAFIGEKGGYNGTTGNFNRVQPLSTLVSNKAPYSDVDKEITTAEIVNAQHPYYIVVLPEEVAREVMKTTNGGYGHQIKPDQWAKGTVYTLKEDPQEKHQNAGLQTISVGSSKLTVGTDTITGTLAFSNTVDADTVDKEQVYTGGEGEFVTFRTDDNFAIISVDAKASKNSYKNQLISGGDTNGNGEPDTVLAGNQQLIFVREDDNKVSVYAWAGAGKEPVAIKGITVLAEDRLNGDDDITSKFYSFKDLKWQAPETKAEITSFTLAGRTGKITSTSDTLGTIDVTVPFNTDLKGLVATFTTSLGAKVVTADGVAMESGKTSLNYNEPVELEVTSEDTHHTKTFTVTVTASNQFDDVTTDKWYYDEVMDAANRGWVNGQGDGIFNPNGDMKRGDFALIVARIMGYNENEFAETVFPDVANDDYYCAAIAFCKQKGLIDGDDKGYFNPEDSITREQMAKIICNARGLTQVSDPVKVYSDDAKIANWAKGYVYACQAEGIMAGEEAVNMFYPKDNASRAEAAAVLVRAFA